MVVRKNSFSTGYQLLMRAKISLVVGLCSPNLKGTKNQCRTFLGLFVHVEQDKVLLQYKMCIAFFGF
jgi:hypothetical protein